MASLYKITEDMRAVEALLDNLVDEEGNPREATEEEKAQLQAWFADSVEEFEQKFDNYCKFIKSLKMSAENADAERKNFKEELDRLSKRSKVSENKAKRMNEMLRFCMERIGLSKFKSDLFSAGVQNTQLSVSALMGMDLSALPPEYLKPRELDAMAVKKAIKDGILEVVEGDKNPLNNGKIRDAESGIILEGLRAVQGTALVIR